MNECATLGGAFSLIVKVREGSCPALRDITALPLPLALLEVAPCVHLSGCSIKCSGGRDKALALYYHSYLASTHLVDVF